MKKLKIYLDTNTIIDFFINQAKAIRNKKLFKMPKKLEFFIDNLDKIDFETSIITQGEIIREIIIMRQKLFPREELDRTNKMYK